MTKQKTQVTENLDKIQASVNSFLKPLGFKKKGRAHNRLTIGDLRHVVTFQMGQFPIGENYVVPGLRESFYGKFWVNLGVFLPCLHQTERQDQPAEFVREYHCAIRDRLGSLAFGTDKPFDLAGDTDAVAMELVDLLDRFGLKFLDQFQSYDDVIKYNREHGELPSRSPERASLDVAIIAHHLGDSNLCKEAFARARAADHKGFDQYVVKIASRLGVTLE